MSAKKHREPWNALSVKKLSISLESIPVLRIFWSESSIMASNLINRLNLALTRCEHFIASLFGPRFPPGALCSVQLGDQRCNLESFCGVKSSPSLRDVLRDGILWAVPKHRRSLEKRMTRRFGIPELHYKMYTPKNILYCPACGHPHEPGILCNHCYGRVKAETKEIQDAIEANLGLEPVEQNVVVLYEGEKELKGADYWKGQRIVELPKKRPAWFHSNLMQPTTQEPAETNDLKPDHLA
ncbi:39S ribosomal protein L32, mitochondrial [Diachasma alloeum]|uniref:39S ribosomal protein L32, mitochondrial n=1 Tax=Diachasma alloeum TaxID=454923 RepID=UPI0007382870|nr:39S ribosomal protein L32, mitochondrial [Diachasma alloeum]